MYRNVNIKNLLLVVGVCIFFLLLPTSMNAQKLSKEQQISDLKNYIGKLKKKHIGLYRYTPKKEMNNFLDSIVHSVSNPCTKKEFYKTIRGINAKIRCGHTVVNYPDETIYHKASFIPLNLISIDNKFYISKNKIPNFSIEHKQIISIDDVNIDTIVQKIKEYLRADGYIETGKNIEIKDFLGQHYAELIDTKPYHKVVFLDTIGKTDTLNIKSLSLNGLIEYELLNKNDSFIKFYSDSLNNYTYLGISSFLGKYKIFKKKLKHIFSKINEGKTENLIVDLRGNHGGYLKNSYLLLSYLIRDKIEVPFKRFIRRGNKDKVWAVERVKPKPNSYVGNLYFLMDGDSFSATSNFLAIAQYLKLGVFVGEETGGAKDGCNSGFYSYKLPISKLVCKIPIQKTIFTKPLSQEGRGVFPDYPIVYSIDDIINNQDLCIEKVINLIKR